MTFAGPAVEDMREVERNFPANFTCDQIVERLGWTKAKARQAIVMGLSLDFFRVVNECPETRLTTYESVLWRRKWVTKPWRKHGRRELGSGYEGQGENVLPVCDGAGLGRNVPNLSIQIRELIKQTIQRPPLNVSGGSQCAE